MRPSPNPKAAGRIVRGGGAPNVPSSQPLKLKRRSFAAIPEPQGREGAWRGSGPQTLPLLHSTTVVLTGCGKAPLRGRATALTRSEAQPPNHQFFKKLKGPGSYASRLGDRGRKPLR
ncbi:hypothetical protein amb1337 [Paramagnetospirillum magneticum AMB-1]|uniref:Uncharacterized protein n=1 Tax=Paramagnetospirillum magneticum (strain ATCC 700264 / AMB-1) TaxID=342108 RepID=Q2W7N4_PARM1|nr:hypothetical protein amb1337 [Paramagnetospirillum magneticum AMB-1]